MGSDRRRVTVRSRFGASRPYATGAQDLQRQLNSTRSAKRSDLDVPAQVSMPTTASRVRNRPQFRDLSANPVGGPVAALSRSERLRGGRLERLVCSVEGSTACLARRQLVRPAKEPELLEGECYVPRGHGALGERRKVASAQRDGRTVLDIDAGDAL
jgi:hypothetical protein